MVNGISINAGSSVGGPAQRAQAITTTQSATRTATPGADTVKLSPTAEARVMLHQGMSVNQIAEKLGMSVQAVSTSLGLTTAAPAVPAVASPQPSSGNK